MRGLGADFLKESFDRLVSQTFQDFDVVVSDHSKDDAIQTLCKLYNDRLTIHYYRNTEHLGNSSANSNNAIKHATGTLIKLLFQDDFLYNDRSLEEIVKAFDVEHDRWLASSYIHTKDGTKFYGTHTPHYTRDVHLGNNRIGTPSAITIKNDRPLFFDEELIWLMDGEYYKRLYAAYGAPKVLNTITVANRIGAHQVTHSMATFQKRKQEFTYVLEKYEHGITKVWYRFFYSLKHIAKIILNHD